jgi:hypothetical protein
MPTDSIMRVKTCKVLHKIGHALAPFHKVKKFMDHKPIATTCDIGIYVDKHEKKNT